ncbi:MAG: hypothetical protein P8Z74_13460 [Acidobacteriota bacterium]
MSAARDGHNHRDRTDGRQTEPKQSHPRMIFGVYGGGIAGTDSGIATGPADEPDRINRALDLLQGRSEEFLVRAYVHFSGPGGSTADLRTPAFMSDYVRDGRTLDLVLCYRDAGGGDLEPWIEFILREIRRFGSGLGKLQITEEPNLDQHPGDGEFFPQVVAALGEGIRRARREIDQLGLPTQVGFNSVPCFDAEDRFWGSLKRITSPSFLEALDFVGLDFFPDVFRRLPPDGSAGDLRQSVAVVLRHFRSVVMSGAGIPRSVPIHITENGWPTGPDRLESRQAEVIETVVRTIDGLREELNITHYEHFALRDAATNQDNWFYRFGLLRDDYSAKPAFDTYRRLIEELS